MIGVQGVYLLSAALFSIGVYGVLSRRNLLIVLMSVELMLNAGNLLLCAMARMHAGVGGDGEGGQTLILMSMAVAACEVAVGLSIVIALFRHSRSVDISSPGATQLRG
ncbi:MAG: NADH-quinone oxidoreductase subunit NuoK [Planctomycetota bacterium]|nr:NADH-quinone oxidoreductase subunit NuoK [Planctomycetota bacterium]